MYLFSSSSGGSHDQTILVPWTEIADKFLGGRGSRTKEIEAGGGSALKCGMRTINIQDTLMSL